MILAADFQTEKRDLPVISKEDEVKRYLRDARLGLQTMMKTSQQGLENPRESENVKEDELIPNYKKLFTASSKKLTTPIEILLISFSYYIFTLLYT